MKQSGTIPTSLGTESIPKLLKQYAVPAIIAMTASSLYNMIDSAYIGQGVGPMAISGLAVTFPLMNLSTAFGTLVGVGASTLISVLLGQRNYSVARRVLGNVIIMNCVIGLLFMAVSLLFLDPILYFFGASEATIPYAREYMQVVLIGNIITHLYFGLNAVLRAAGHPRKAMYATILTVALNTILDPIFIFVLDMGIRGAAIATVISQLVSLIWQIKIFSNKEEFLHFSKDMMKFDSKIAYRSLSIGMAPFLMNVASCFIVILINKGLQTYGDMEMAGGGDLSIGAYGIINRLSFLFVMVVMGFTQGMQPIAGYNYGAQLYDRVIKVLRLTIICATIVMTAGFLVAMIFPELMVKIFTSDPQLIDLSSKGARVVFLAFPIVGFQIVTSNFFQSLGMAKKAIFLSLSRQLLFLAPCLIILPRLIGVKGVWLSLPISDIISTIVTIFMLRTLLKQFNEEIRKQRVITEGN
ncbi:MAG: MATE family efflux transporter [Bacteroidales bacterium]|nr:MATE family efflux transporter [Bacteroidales bacterium]